MKANGSLPADDMRPQRLRRRRPDEPPSASATASRVSSSASKSLRYCSAIAWTRARSAVASRAMPDCMRRHTRPSERSRSSLGQASCSDCSRASPSRARACAWPSSASTASCRGRANRASTRAVSLRSADAGLRQSPSCWRNAPGSGSAPSGMVNSTSMSISRTHSSRSPARARSSRRSSSTQPCQSKPAAGCSSPSAGSIRGTVPTMSLA